MQEKQKQDSKAVEQKNSNVSMPVQQETEYEVQELADNRKTLFGFNMSKESVIAAFKTEGISRATVTQAKKIVEEFLRKEIY